MNSTFNRNILTLITGNAIAFIIPVLLYPVLSRIFTTEDYALFGLYISVFSFLEIASAGRYDFTVVMPDKDEDAVNLVAGGLLVSLAYAICILLIVIFLRGSIADALNNPALADWLLLLPLALILVSIGKLCNSWLVRVKRFKAASINKASQKLTETGSQLLLGLTGAGNGLIVGDITGRTFNAYVSVYQSIKAGLDRSKASQASIKYNLKKYLDIPMFSIAPSMLNTLGGMLPVFIISSFYSVETSGSFNFSRIILSVPFALIAAGISQVLMQQVSEKRNKNETIHHDVYSLGIKLAMVSALAALPVYFAGPDLFAVIFGNEWRLSGEYTQVLIFSYAVSFVVAPFSMLLVILGKVRLASVWQLSYFLANTALWIFDDIPIKQFLVIHVAIDVLSYFVYGLLIHKTIKEYETTLR